METISCILNRIWQHKIKLLCILIIWLTIYSAVCSKAYLYESLEQFLDHLSLIAKMEISIYTPDDSEKIYLSFIDRVNLYFTTKVLDGLFNDMKNIYEDNININNMSVIIKIPTKYKWDLLNSNYYKTNTEGIIEVYSLIYINYLLGEENDQIRIIPSEHINKYNNFEVVRCIFNAYSKMFFTGNNQVIGFSSNVKCELFSTQHYENKLGEQKHKNIDKMIFNFTGNYYNCSSEEIKNLSHKDKFYYDTNLHNFHLNYREIPQ